MTAPTNCLAGLKCPKCSHTDGFKIEATCLATVFDDGVDDAVEYDWNEHSACQCRSCDYRGLVGDFQGADVAASFCQEKLLGDTTHPHIGAVYALMRQASIHYPDITGLRISLFGLEFLVGESVRLPLPALNASMMCEVVDDKTLRGKTFHFMPKGGVPSEAMAVLSTGHLSFSDRMGLSNAFGFRDDEDQWLIGAEREEGFLIYTNLEACPLPGLRRVLNTMLNAGFVWVLFDANGEYVDELPIYE